MLPIFHEINIYPNLTYEPFLFNNFICPPYPECLTEDNLGIQYKSLCFDECSLYGDMNEDNEINVVDIVQIVGCIMEDNCNICSDYNDDGVTNVVDIVQMVQFILNN